HLLVSMQILWLFLVCFIPAVEAYDAGDAIAILLGSVLTGVGFCACLGWYAFQDCSHLLPAHLTEKPMPGPHFKIPRCQKG
uniref:Uncharacterized protein n=1 Tax=Periophthalmus magnuspinnatus TaxID=409849 RepID=A0A3B3ZQM2_9GOBI